MNSLTRPVHADEPARTYRVLTHADCGLMFSVLGLQRYCACKQHLSLPVRANGAEHALGGHRSESIQNLLELWKVAAMSLPGSAPRNRCLLIILRRRGEAPSAAFQSQWLGPSAIGALDAGMRCTLPPFDAPVSSWAQNSCEHLRASTHSARLRRRSREPSPDSEPAPWERVLSE